MEEIDQEMNEKEQTLNTLMKNFASKRNVKDAVEMKPRSLFSREDATDDDLSPVSNVPLEPEKEDKVTVETKPRQRVNWVYWNVLRFLSNYWFYFLLELFIIGLHITAFGVICAIYPDVVSHTGCTLTLPLIIATCSQAGLHLFLGFVATIFTIQKREYTYMKWETFILACVWIISLIIFAVLANLRIMQDVVDYIVPYGYVIIIPSFIDQIITAIVPSIATFFFTPATKNEEQLMIDLRNVMAHDAHRKMFKQYSLGLSNALENILFYEQVENYKFTSVMRKRAILARDIYDIFLQTNGPLFLKTSNVQVMNKIQQDVEKFGLYDGLFDELQKENTKRFIIPLFKKFWFSSQNKRFLKTRKQSINKQPKPKPKPTSKQEPATIREVEF